MAIMAREVKISVGNSEMAPTTAQVASKIKSVAEYIAGIENQAWQ